MPSGYIDNDRPPATARPIFWAWPAGQSEDRALSLPDGSRLHWRRFGDRWERHRDHYDPDRGTLSLLAHLALETPVLVAGVALAAVFVLFVRGGTGG